MEQSRVDRMWEYHKEALSAVREIVTKMRDDPKVDSDSLMTNVLVLIKVLVEAVENAGVPRWVIMDAIGFSGEAQGNGSELPIDDISGEDGRKE